MYMMTSKILSLVNSWKTEKSLLKVFPSAWNEIFSANKTIHSLDVKGCIMAKNNISINLY